MMRSQLHAKLLCNDAAATMASRATGFLMTVCFFFLPLLWSNMIHHLPAATCQQHGYDPWSELTELQ
uniref:Col_cuticle_N domain-containing protein n=1 Tax=Ascaris lumbricoides TaxID=6252 RepID=A0A0M3HXG0_ASCLU